MRAFKSNSHKYIELFGDAAMFSKYTISLISYSDIKLPQILLNSTKAITLKQLFYPFGLAVLLRDKRHHDVVLIREFLTVPLFLAAPVLWRYRKNTLFVLVHNIQMAHLRMRDRIALRCLFKVGFRFVALESDSGIHELGIKHKGSQVLVLPLAHYSEIDLKDRNDKPKEKITVGIIGRMRPEKTVENMLDVFDRTIQSIGFKINILVGCDNNKVLEEAQKMGFQTMDTASTENYEKAITLSDIVVIWYDANRYRYRTSGVIADAAYRGSIVLCPDYPLFRAQISNPCSVGATFNGQESLPGAIIKAMNMAFDDQVSFSTYIRYRRPENIARIIDTWIESYKK